MPRASCVSLEQLFERRKTVRSAAVLTSLYPSFRNCSVQDADKLDAIGAFGVLRCAAFSGARNISLFNPDDAPIEGMTKEQYEQQTNNGGGSSINHFHGEIRCFILIWFVMPMI